MLLLSFSDPKKISTIQMSRDENWDIPFGGFRESFSLTAGYFPKNIISWNEHSFEVFTVCNMDILG